MSDVFVKHFSYLQLLLPNHLTNYNQTRYKIKHPWVKIIVVCSNAGNAFFSLEEVILYIENILNFESQVYSNEGSLLFQRLLRGGHDYK